MQWQKYINPSSAGFLFLVFFAFVNGISWGFADTYDHLSNVDIQTYVGLSEFDFNQSPVRRYRVIIPMLAALVNFVFGGIFSALSPNDFPGDFPTIFSFLLVNNVFMALFAVGVFRLCQHYLGNLKDKFLYCFLGVASILTCRWTMVLAGSALVDSLFLVTIVILLLGILKRKWMLVVVALYLGPWAKESFVFFVPLLLFYDRKFYPKIFMHLILSGIIVFAFRYYLDSMIGADPLQSLGKDTAHFSMIGQSLRRLFSFHGIYELFSIAGFWNVIIAIALSIKCGKAQLSKLITPFWFVFVAVIMIQALLSYELARMFYLLTPLVAVVVAISFECVFATAAETN